MNPSPLLVFHISAGVVSLAAGTLSMLYSKGSSGHRLAGNLFVLSMLAMGLSGVYMSIFIKPIMVNVIAGCFVTYLVATSWRAGRQRAANVDGIDRLAFAFVSAICMASLTFGIQATRSPSKLVTGVPASAYFAFGVIALLFVIGDIRLLKNGGAAGGRRIARHLMRMCTAFLIAVFSIYPGQAKLFPMWLRNTHLLIVPHVLLLGSMFYWRARMLRGAAPRSLTSMPMSEAQVRT